MDTSRSPYWGKHYNQEDTERPPKTTCSGGCGTTDVGYKYLKDCPKCKYGTLMGRTCIDCGYVVKKKLKKK